MQNTPIGYNPKYSENAPTTEQIKSLNKDAILEFGAPWCPHCQAAMPAIKEVLSEHSFQDLPHIKIFDGKGKRLGRSFKVKLWPTFILLRDGEELARLVRPLRTKDIREFLQESL